MSVADLTSSKKMPNRELIAELQEICSRQDIKVSLVSKLNNVIFVFM